MFIDIGNGNVIQSSTIIAIIDYELISSSVLLQEMVDQAKQEKTLKGPTVQAKSMMVTTKGTYVSTLSVATLKKRTSIKATIKHMEDYYE
ncbi:extracellular matrix regulator RemB [Oceanobacillus alkalisoli]|uniref:extracellular matrix regulator RemB n=1 Tax=Oceanobacillus alkalisoli TaxID=2925113 RepID=UPI001EEFC6ED|nr:extracellular matrix/biofilm biosynthesis regulator RemA family protein [Oceanobacillus alkalisoli]MCF3944015.1 DUF370 domain-containing protein [Oceanobacillus alkalisoli]MCG5103287.1 DUF370 domain-containing protein [Oceanobacillus alkalisoli]